MKNIEDDVSLKSRNLIDIIDNDLKLRFLIFVVFAKQTIVMKWTKSFDSLQTH